MTHAIVVVRVDGSVEADDVQAHVERLLAPYHEFECTGHNDEFVQNIDRTEEVRKEIAERSDKTETVAAFVEGYHGWKLVTVGEQPDIESTHKYGWFRVDAAGELVEAFDRTNPNCKWDWWVIGGRWSGYFPLRMRPDSTVDVELQAAQEEYDEFQKRRTGAASDHARYLELNEKLRQLGELAYLGRRRQSGVRLGRAGTFNNVPEKAHGDIVRKSEIDFDAVAAKTRESIERFWDEWSRFISGEKFDSFDGPRFRALKIGILDVRKGPPEPGEESRCIPWRGKLPDTDIRSTWHDVYKLITLEQLYAEYADAFSPIAGYAYLDETGWHEPGRMGWFGCSSETPDQLLESKRTFTRWLKETPDAAWLVAVDYHI